MNQNKKVQYSFQKNWVQAATHGSLGRHLFFHHKYPQDIVTKHALKETHSQSDRETHVISIKSLTKFRNFFRMYLIGMVWFRYGTGVPILICNACPKRTTSKKT